MDNIIISSAALNLPYQFEVRTLIGGRNEQQDFAGVFYHNGMLLCVVCDGMGGEYGGADASKTAVLAVQAELERFDVGMDIPRFLLNMLTIANDAVYALLKEQGGTTIVLTAIYNDLLYWGSAGDSKLFLVRNKEMLQATRDHNYRLQLNELLQSGRITPQTYKLELVHENVTLYDLTENGLPLYPGDFILLTTDGLPNAVHPETVLGILRAESDLALKANAMVEAINCSVELDQQDNSTFILIQI